MKLGLVSLGVLAAALPAAAWAQGAPLAETPPPPQRAAEIETQHLQALDAWTVGTMAGQQGALPRNAWAQSDPAVLAALYDRLPGAYESPAAQVIARRVLLSGADAPRGDAALAARKRFEALGKMGAADELSQMASGANGALNDAAIAQYAAQAELARGRRAEACARGRAAQGETPAHFILRLRAFCAAAGGDRAAADLALELARGNGGEDAWFTGAIAAVGGAPPARPLAARYDNSLSAAISLQANLRPGANPLANASTMALLTLARSDAAGQPLRAQAAALAFRRGALSAQDARAIFAAVPADVTTGLPPIVTTLRQVSAAPGSAAAGAAIAALLAQSNTPADFAAASRFFRDDIAAFAAAEAQPAQPMPAPEPGAAVLLARTALINGDAALAQRLIARAQRAGADAGAMAPLEAASAVMQGARGGDAQMAVQRRIDGAGSNGRASAARDLMLMQASGFPLDGAALAFVLANAPQTGARADAGAMAALDAAVERQSAGEIALAAAVVTGAGASRLDADSLADVLRALKTARLDGDARRMAVEAILAGAPS